jgi:hypothetical protein
MPLFVRSSITARAAQPMKKNLDPRIGQLSAKVIW